MSELKPIGSLKDKVAIVTGGGTGIGRAATQAMVNEGGRVLIVGRREQPLKDLTNEYPDRVSYLQADVSQAGCSQLIIETVLETYGKLDILVNNAASAVLKPLALLSDDEIVDMLNVNIKGLLSLSRDAIPALEQSSGCIINISSVAAQSAVPGFTAYAATKSAIDRSSKILAAELGPAGVRVNVVSPGLTQTDMLSATPESAIDTLVNEATALRRLGKPEEVAETIIWLASDQSKWVTGQVIQASGGLLLS